MRSLKLKAEVFALGGDGLGRTEKSVDHKDMWEAAYQAENVREGGKAELPDFAQI